MDQKRLERLEFFAQKQIEYLRVEDLVPRLFSLEVINIKEKQQLQREADLKGTIAEGSLLVDFLMTKDSHCFDKFVSALEYTGQEHLAQFLQHQLAPEALLSKSDKQLIQHHFSEFVNGIHFRKLLALLKNETNYFTRSEIEKLEAESTERKQNDYLLSQVILRGTYRHLNIFHKCLIEIGQENLAKYLPVEDTEKLAATPIKTETEDIKVIVELENPRKFKDLRAIIVTKIIDPSQDLRKKLIQTYELTTLEADSVIAQDEQFYLTMVPKRSPAFQKILEDISNENLAKIIKTYSRLKDDPPWYVKIRTQFKAESGAGAAASFSEHSPLTKAEREHIMEGYPTFIDQLIVDPVIIKLYTANIISSQQYDYLNKSFNMARRDKVKYIIQDVLIQSERYEHIETFGQILVDTQQYNLEKLLPKREPVLQKLPKFSMNPPPKPQHLVRAEGQQGPGQLPIVKKVLFTMVGGKDHTPYDLWTHLKKYKGKVYDTPNQLKNEEGFNLLHASVDKGRLSLFTVFMHMGWWKFLSEQKVSSDSLNEHKGRIPKQIAEVKRTRKPLDEVNQFTEWENSLSSVMKASRQGDIRKVEQQIQIEAEQIHYRDSNNGNALYWAVVGGNEKILEMLLKHGIDPTMRTKKGETLLHIACMLGHHNMVKLLKDNDVDTGLEDQSHKTAFDRVAENGDIDTLIAMMKVGLYPGPNFPVLASYCGRKPCLEYCIELLDMPVDSKDIYSRTPLQRAIEGSKVEITKYLLEKQASTTLITCSLRNVLHIVAESGNEEIFKILVKELKKKDTLQGLINELDRYNGVDLCFLIRGRDRGRDAWHYVEVGRSKVPIFLKKTKSGNVDVAAYGTVIKSGWGVNPDQDNVEQIEAMFKERRLNENAPRDMTPLHIAIFKGNTKVAQLLIENDAKVNIKDKFGMTPLMVAAAKGFLDIVQELERKGAKFKDVNLDGKTACEIADENENDEIVNYVQGRDYYQMCTNFLQGDVVRLKEELGPDQLNAVRAEGTDVKRHLVNTLRDFRIDINQFLLDLGSGPVLEASEN